MMQRNFISETIENSEYNIGSNIFDGYPETEYYEKRKFLKDKMHSALIAWERAYADAVHLLDTRIGYFTEKDFPFNLNEINKEIDFYKSYQDMLWKLEPDTGTIGHTLPRSCDEVCTLLDKMHNLMDKMENLRLRMHNDAMQPKTLSDYIRNMNKNFIEVYKSQLQQTKNTIRELVTRRVTNGDIKISPFLREKQLHLFEEENIYEEFHDMPEYFNSESQLAEYLSKHHHSDVDRLIKALLINDSLQEIINKLEGNENFTESDSIFEMINFHFKQLDENPPKSLFDIIDRKRLSNVFCELYKLKRKKSLKTSLARSDIQKTCDVIISIFAALVKRRYWLNDKAAEICNFIVNDLNIYKFKDKLKSLRRSVKYLCDKNNYGSNDNRIVFFENCVYFYRKNEILKTARMSL